MIRIINRTALSRVQFHAPRTNSLTGIELDLVRPASCLSCWKNCIVSKLDRCVRNRIELSAQNYAFLTGMFPEIDSSTRADFECR